ncbi:hypothetical protein ABEG17_09985 [Pedococcus sp. KACC 23699]|uniref:Uncharacterized protein n=1 Tax=Pedococcus sp. KACC 23699 TaxID=3149228 RepID=A0AAU7JNQ8_9MICO
MADFSVDSTVFGGNTFLADVTSNLSGLDDMKFTVAGGTTNTNNGENTLHTDATVTLQPVTTTSTVTAGVDSTLKSDSSVDTRSSLDLKPVAVDTCVRLELGPPPATEVCMPYDQQWSWSVLGVDLFAITVRGSTTAHIRPEHHGPVVIDL